MASDKLIVNFENWLLGNGKLFALDYNSNYRSNLPVTLLNSSAFELTFTHTHSANSRVSLQLDNYFYTNYQTVKTQNQYGWNKVSA